MADIDVVVAGCDTTAGISGDQADSVMRVAQPAADGDLLGLALDRRGDPGVAESAG